MGRSPVATGGYVLLPTFSYRVRFGVVLLKNRRRQKLCYVYGRRQAAFRRSATSLFLQEGPKECQLEEAGPGAATCFGGTVWDWYIPLGRTCSAGCLKLGSAILSNVLPRKREACVYMWGRGLKRRGR